MSDVVYDNAAAAPDAVAFGRPEENGWSDVTAAEFAREVRSVAQGLIGAGIAPGERVAIMSRTRYEWTLFDYAIWSAGAVPVPIYETSSAEQVRWVLQDSGAVAIIVESEEHARTVDGLRADLPDLREVWTLEESAVATLNKLGADIDPATVDERRHAVTAVDLATIIYTSGTTGRPKGCRLTHENLLFEVEAAVDSLDTLFHDGAATLLFLPIAHVLGRVIQCAIVRARIKLGHLPDTKNIMTDLQEFRPTFLLVVPRVLEKVYNGAKQRAHSEGKGAIFDQAEKIAIRHSRARDTGRIPLSVSLQHRLFDRLVYAKLRAALGGRCHGAISGGAPLGERLGHFFRGIGLFVYEGYGLTETTAAACVNRDGATRIGTVGKPLPGIAVRIADDGEVLFSGPVVFTGYWHNDAATAEAIRDGWFHTGDLGELDDAGFLRITGRKKEIIVTAGGKNVSPAVLEDQLRAHPLISQCMVIGDQKPFIAVLVTLDPEAVPDWARRHGKPEGSELRADTDLRAEIQQAIEAANKAVSRAESIRKFHIVAEDFTEQTGELTPSLKVKRAVVLERHAIEIAELYG
ncbi:MAG TPA: long-chain fatty acid--CoA ligase [Mycobacteriales bacterium]|nr:long-chain fatty acid--CoA ligase [Mycobacteriales bacterium]